MPQKKYTEDFKQQIVDLYNMGNKSISKLEGEYDISKSTMNGWIKKYHQLRLVSQKL
ncbi:transposase [Clostridium sp.]|uniref:transposase n=1 Tax=Clostridium sp. TaxID=1506 RepID=UPI003217E9BE